MVDRNFEFENNLREEVQVQHVKVTLPIASLVEEASLSLYEKLKRRNMWLPSPCLRMLVLSVLSKWILENNDTQNNRSVLKREKKLVWYEQGCRDHFEELGLTVEFGNGVSGNNLIVSLTEQAAMKTLTEYIRMFTAPIRRNATESDHLSLMFNGPVFAIDMLMRGKIDICVAIYGDRFQLERCDRGQGQERGNQRRY